MRYYNKQLVEIPAKETVTITFYGREPNYFRVANSGKARIYCGLLNMPSPSNYEFKVEAYNTRMYCEEHGYKSLYIYNSSASAVKVLVYSFNAPFDPVVQAMSDFVFSDNESTVNVEIQGFTESLPAGNNKIGKVSIDGMLSPLPAGNNSIGKVVVESLPADVVSKILALPNKDYSTNISTILTRINDLLSTQGFINTKLSTIKEYVDLQNTAPTSVTISGTGTYSGRFIKLFTNDGTTDIKLTSAGNKFILKAGESIVDFPLGESAVSFTIAPNTSGESISGRLLYIG